MGGVRCQPFLKDLSHWKRAVKYTYNVQVYNVMYMGTSAIREINCKATEQLQEAKPSSIGVQFFLNSTLVFVITY